MYVLPPLQCCYRYLKGLYNLILAGTNSSIPLTTCIFNLLIIMLMLIIIIYNIICVESPLTYFSDQCVCYSILLKYVIHYTLSILSSTTHLLLTVSYCICLYIIFVLILLWCMYTYYIPTHYVSHDSILIRAGIYIYLCVYIHVYVGIHVHSQLVWTGHICMYMHYLLFLLCSSSCIYIHVALLACMDRTYV